MAIVEPVEGLSYYMDDRLKQQLDKKVRKAIQGKDQDYVIVVDGMERSGKSTFSLQIGRYLDPSLNLSRVCFNPIEFREAIIKAKPYQCVIFDEAFRGFSSRGVLTEVNKILVTMLMEIGQKNLIIIICLPTFFLLDKYVALWRARALFHIVIGKTARWWKCYNRKKKQLLYLHGKKDYNYNIKKAKTTLIGKFYGKYALDEKAYRKKKAKSLKEGFKDIEINKYLSQRNKLIYLINQEMQLSIRSIQELFNKYEIGLKRSNIGTILKNIKDLSNN